MSAAAVRTVQLSKRYGTRQAVDGLDLEVAQGECLALLGPNGAGKSTLLRLLCSLARPSSGQVWLFGRRLERGAASSSLCGALGYVGHALLAYRPLSARQNLEFFGRLYGLDRVATRVEGMLARFGLAGREDEPLSSLSRGLQQRVSLARAFLHEPRLLLLDEPFNSLDSTGAAVLESALGEARQAGRTVILATHDLERAAALAGRLAVLRRGRLAHVGPPPGDTAEWRSLYRRTLAGEAA